MTDQMTRAAEILEGYAEFIKAEQADNLERHPYIPDIDEAARILRAAAGADVAGLMDVADRYALAQADPAHWRSALESALRLALAAREDDVFAALDLSPDAFRTEGGAVNVGKLRAAIRHPADYLPSWHWLRPVDEKAVYAAIDKAAQQYEPRGHRWVDSSRLGGTLCADCGAILGSSRGGTKCTGTPSGIAGEAAAAPKGTP